MRYTVVDNRTGSVVCEEATACEAMRAMGMKARGTFYSAVSRVRTGENRRWTIKSTGKKSYTVYDNGTDFPVCVYATAREAKEKMGLKTMNSFYSTISKVRNGKNNRWTIVEEDEDPSEV